MNYISLFCHYWGKSCLIYLIVSIYLVHETFSISIWANKEENENSNAIVTSMKNIYNDIL